MASIFPSLHYLPNMMVFNYIYFLANNIISFLFKDKQKSSAYAGN